MSPRTFVGGRNRELSFSVDGSASGWAGTSHTPGEFVPDDAAQYPYGRLDRAEFTPQSWQSWGLRGWNDEL